MNLELLDPFGRQIPDRIDATLTLPKMLHFKCHSGDEQECKTVNHEWKCAFHACFNRRGLYLAIGHGSGAVSVHNMLSRTLAALYRNDEPTANPSTPGFGVTSVTWSRRSRSLLAGAAGDKKIRLFDNTHPFGPEESCYIAVEERGLDDSSERVSEEVVPSNHTLSTHSLRQTQDTSFLDEDARFVFMKESKLLNVKTADLSSELSGKRYFDAAMQSDMKGVPRYPSLTFELPSAVGGALQIHPTIPTAGLAALANGSLVIFWVHSSAFYDIEGYDAPEVLVIPLHHDKGSFISTAAFSPHGGEIYAGSKDGKIVGFDVAPLWKMLASHTNKSHTLPTIAPKFKVSALAGASAWHLVVSRNGKLLVVNSSDGCIRLFSTKCWNNPKGFEKPVWQFQDVVSKIKFASCDLSGDAEYVVGGANGEDNKYELYIWNTSTGALMDKLTGSSVHLYSVSWHPTRSFIAVATSDGIVDIWGPRINWTAFAPDFQALPMNVEYIEREDEFDVDEHGHPLAIVDSHCEMSSDEHQNVDVITVEPVPVFASDSEEEEKIFEFEPKVKNLLASRGGRNKSANLDD